MRGSEQRAAQEGAALPEASRGPKPGPQPVPLSRGGIFPDRGECFVNLRFSFPSQSGSGFRCAFVFFFFSQEMFFFLKN